MLISIVGPRYSGKSTIESYLVANKAFASLRLTSGSSSTGSIIDAPDLQEDTMRSAWAQSPDLAHQELSQFPIPPNSGVFKQHLSFLSLSPVTQHVAWSEDSSKSLSFSSPAEMLDYVTLNWRDNFVTVDLSTRDLLEKFIRRPFFMLLNVDAPVLIRYSRSREHERRSLEEFIREDDEIFFGNSKNNGEIALRSLHDLIDININNDFCQISELHAHVDGLNLLDPQHLRPSWDAYFMVIILQSIIPT
ncbi:hypothetical protein AGABI2DRAFT_113851 [Agaricus bisporus var. bisporus H97]|uniref:hypothetical protein n=1 Tax=Agaricus bisporus var. bisporus (strain H97 / ATCC MYA-4626 / FGSC 10389) TaxID=936046 RepID=UPI00029F4FE2|nr:hypothetical protein AGABI2DRAFT_113851 [Agaricus bisporus var. bisporus H97]EKV51110.1 hypothetical protein AGABI2DRAFT_113851 [Agaricus bisporus var. bisporus H97]